MITNWEDYGAAWYRHSEQLAAVLSTQRFHLVSSAFACLASLAASRGQDLSKPLALPRQPTDFGPSDEILALYEANIEAAKQILLRVSFRFWEARARNKALAEKPHRIDLPTSS